MNDSRHRSILFPNQRSVEIPSRFSPAIVVGGQCSEPIVSNDTFVLQDQLGVKGYDEHASSGIAGKKWLFRCAFRNGLPPCMFPGADALFNGVGIKHTGKPAKGRGENLFLWLGPPTDLHLSERQ